MKKLLPAVLLCASVFTPMTSHSALILDALDGGRVSTLDCLADAINTPDYGDCNILTLITTTTLPVLVVLDLNSGVTSEETQVALINEALGVSKESTATTMVSKHLELTNDQVQVAVKHLYKNAEVTIQNIEIYYGL